MDTTQSLQNSSATLEMSLDNIAMSVDNLRTQCISTLPGANPPLCANIPPSSDFETEANFSAVSAHVYQFFSLCQCFFSRPVESGTALLLLFLAFSFDVV